MTPNQNPYARYGATARDAAEIDAGLRAYMLQVYNYMAVGLGITGVAAIVAFNLAVTGDAGSAAVYNGVPAMIRPDVYLTAIGVALYTSPLKWVVILAPLGMVFFLSARVQNMSTGSAQLTFWIFAALMGLSLSSLGLVYTNGSIARVFFITAASFGGLSLYGYTTQKDLSGWGSFLFMGLIGIIIASLVNIFLASSALQFAISVIGVLVFAGLTAYDTQQIKEMYFEGDDSTTMSRKAIMGALRLYLDFINLFIMLLHLFGSRE